MGQDNSKSNLFIKITEGQTQSHQLFDFQNGGFQQQEKIVKSPSFLVNKGETVEYIQQQNSISLAATTSLIPPNAIYKITQDEYQQITIKDLSTVDNRHLWRIVKPNQSYPIKTGDMLKIGKIKIQLKRIVQKKQDNHIQQETVKDINQNDQLESLHSNHSNCDRCRICFRSYNLKTDPLLCLCKCSGSIKYIHFLCLKDWIANSITKRQDQYCKFYTYQQTCCQLCKNPLPNSFKHQGRSYSFFQFSTFEPPYAQFEYFQQQSQNKKKYYKYIINLQKDKQVMIGRNNSSQVVMKDISISRTHCSLEYKHGIVLLRDKKSKFGTLIKVDKTLEFNSQTGLQLQFDSKMVQLYRKNTLKGCCCSQIDNYKLIFDSNQQQVKPNQQIRQLRQIQQNNQNLIEQTIFNRSLLNNQTHMQILRMDGQSENIFRSMSGRSLVRSNPQLINEGLIMMEQDNFMSPGERNSTMVRETMARDEDIQY